MRLVRTTPGGVTYASSFRKKPSRRLLKALDALAQAAADHLLPNNEHPGLAGETQGPTRRGRTSPLPGGAPAEDQPATSSNQDAEGASRATPCGAGAARLGQ